MTLRGIERQDALRPRRIHLLAKLRGHALPPFAAQDRGLNLFLQLDLLRAIGGRRLEPIERVLLLLERELGAGSRRRVNRHDARDAFIARGSQQGDPRAFAVTEHRNALRIDVLPIAEPFHDGADIVCDVADRRGFTAPAALSVAALVVAHGHEPRLRDCARKVARESARHRTCRRDRRIRRRRSGSTAGRRPAVFGGPRHRRAQVEARRGNHDRFVARV